MVPECRYIKPSGDKCGSPAMKARSHCYFHAPERLRAKCAVRPRYFLELSLPESRASIQAALRDVFQKLVNAQIDTSHAGRLLYALQLASREPVKRVACKKPASNRRSYRIEAADGIPHLYRALPNATGPNLNPES